MTKKDIITTVALATGQTKKATEETINATITAIKASILAGDKIQFTGDFTISPKHSKAREGRNPSTGGKLQIEASNGISIKIGKTFKNQLNK